MVAWPHPRPEAPHPRSHPQKAPAPSSKGQEPLVASLLLVAMPGAPSSFLFLVAMPGAPSSFLFLVAMPGAPSSVLAPSSDARSP